MYFLTTLLSLLSASSLVTSHPTNTDMIPSRVLSQRQNAKPSETGKAERRHAAVTYLCDCEIPTRTQRQSLLAYYDDFIDRTLPIVEPKRLPKYWSRVSGVTNNTYAEWGGNIHGWENYNKEGTPRDQFSFNVWIQGGPRESEDWAGRGDSPQKGKFLCFKDDHRVLFQKGDGDNLMQCYSTYFCTQ